jgi:aminopeptidase N
VVEQFVVGGMENTSATTLTERVMHDERAFLDSSPDGLIAHELAHQWWGDLLTCRDWSHLWLNEGFASYCEVLWVEHKLGPEERDYALYSKSKAARSEKALTRPVVDYHYGDPGDMFDSRAYPKGAWVLHMLRKRVGDEDFFRALERYGTAHAYTTVETSDLRRVFERLLGMSLDRFFHDWTGRPAHPRLKISTSHDAEKKLVHLEIQQTQDGEAFEFPLRVELSEADSSAPIVVEQVINEKSLSLYVPVLTRPTQVRVDPDYSLLAEIEEDKPDDWWQAQLTAPTVLERIRAVEHFGKSKQDTDRRRLAKVLTDDAFYGVQMEAATALGSSGGDVSRDALLEGLAHAHPKVRRSCAEALGKFVDDEQVLAGLRGKQAEGDASYFVEAQVLTSLAKVQRRPEIEPFLAALEVDSHNEVIREAALEALGSSFDPRALDVLVEWTKRGRQRTCRIAAMGAVARFLKRNDVTPAQQSAALDVLLGSLEGESTRVRRAAIGALRELGTTAGRPAMALLRSLAQHDPDDRVRSAAADAVKQLVADNPAADELGRLRTEIEDLERRNRELEDRLLQLEAK